MGDSKNVKTLSDYITSLATACSKAQETLTNSSIPMCVTFYSFSTTIDTTINYSEGGDVQLEFITPGAKLKTANGSNEANKLTISCDIEPLVPEQRSQRSGAFR